MTCELCPEQVTRPGQRPTQMQKLTDHSLSAPDSNRRRQQASMALSKITIDLHLVFTKASLPLSILSPPDWWLERSWFLYTYVRRRQCLHQEDKNFICFVHNRTPGPTRQPGTRWALHKYVLSKWVTFLKQEVESTLDGKAQNLILQVSFREVQNPSEAQLFRKLRGEE